MEVQGLGAWRGLGQSPKTSLVVGVGFSSRASALDIARLVEACLEGRPASVLAIPESRAALAAAGEAASLLGLALLTIIDADIERVQDRCLTRPCRAARAVAEGVALAAAGDAAALLGPRTKTARVTCALAQP